METEKKQTELKDKKRMGFFQLMETPNSELKFGQKCRKLFNHIGIAFFGFLIIHFLNKASNEKAIEREKRNKLKYFTPIIEEGTFSNKTTWVMRENPLTEEQLDEVLKVVKL
jgi:large-conductance mechanosensitive channel